MGIFILGIAIIVLGIAFGVKNIIGGLSSVLSSETATEAFGSMGGTFKKHGIAVIIVVIGIGLSIIGIVQMIAG